MKRIENRLRDCTGADVCFAAWHTAVVILAQQMTRSNGSFESRLPYRRHGAPHTFSGDSPMAA